MRKIFFGILIGVGLSLGFTAYADDIASLIGKKVDGSFPLMINNVRADKDVLVIQGTSYMPVKAAGTLFGYDVSFSADLMVILTSKSDMVIKKPTDGTAPSPTPIPTPTATPFPTSTPKPTSTAVPAATVAPEPVESKEAVMERIQYSIIGVNSQINVIKEEIAKKEATLKSIQLDVNQSATAKTIKGDITRLKALLADYTKQLEKLNKSLKDLNK